MGFWSMIKLKNEAILLDSKWYMTKAFFAVMTAYIIAVKNPILKLDTISVLFGLMLTLEPVTLTGIKNGLNQIYATALGAISTAVIIYLFQILGINMVWTIALSMAFTLYVCLKIDWRAVSPVAIFTSIYMTQYIQKTPAGEPSIWLTFRLRLFALGTGVIIAIIFNFIFALISYRKMMNKRITFLVKLVIDSLNDMVKTLRDNNEEGFSSVKNKFPPIFNNIDWVYSLFEDMKKEYKYKAKIVGFKRENLIRIQSLVLFLRDITHLNYDIVYVLMRKDFQWDSFSDGRERVIIALNGIIHELEIIGEALDKGYIDLSSNMDSLEAFKFNYVSEQNSMEPLNRVYNDLQDISSTIKSIKGEMKNVFA